MLEVYGLEDFMRRKISRRSSRLRQTPKSPTPPKRKPYTLKPLKPPEKKTKNKKKHRKPSGPAAHGSALRRDLPRQVTEENGGRTRGLGFRV